MLPPFTDDGLLPLGDYPLTLDELRTSMLVVGPRELVAAGQWDSGWRAQLVENLAVLVGHLWRVGIDRVFIDGSFVEDKPKPGDIDGYFECDVRRFVSGALANDLNALAGEPIWNWAARLPDPDSAKWQLQMWHKYRVELYPHYNQGAGILDEHGHEQQFPAAFRQRRFTFQPKGIVQLVRPAEAS